MTSRNLSSLVVLEGHLDHVYFVVSLHRIRFKESLSLYLAISLYGASWLFSSWLIWAYRVNSFVFVDQIAGVYWWNVI